MPEIVVPFEFVRIAFKRENPEEIVALFDELFTESELYYITENGEVAIEAFDYYPRLYSTKSENIL